jgi:hypothetical protein
MSGFGVPSKPDVARGSYHVYKSEANRTRARISLLVNPLPGYVSHSCDLNPVKVRAEGPLAVEFRAGPLV